MTDTKFTPGPWHYVHGQDRNGNFWGCVQASPVIIPAKVNYPDQEETDRSGGQYVLEVAHANAHLIASAPELYEALDGLVVFCSDTLSGRADGATDVAWLIDGYREIRNRCRAALIKARGETP